MFRYSIINHCRWSVLSSLISRHSSKNYSPTLKKNFDKKTFDYFYTRRLKIFHDNQQQMSNHIRTHLESLLKTSSIITNLNDLNTRNTMKNFSQTLTIEQFNDLLFFAYEHNIKLDFLIKRLIECLIPMNKTISSNLFIEFINLLVLHQQKYYDYQTKNPNKILENIISSFEFNLTDEQIKNISLIDLSLLCSAMYRLQMPLKNQNLLDYIGQYLINDEKKKILSAVDKQNFIKILTLSNYGKISIANSLTNRFNQSFEQHRKLKLNTFSYEIVRMTMRIGIYLLTFRFYSKDFFHNCLKLIEFESNSSSTLYRAKDMIQIMNTLIYMGYIKKNNIKYMNLIYVHDKMKQFEQKPERLVDVLAPLAMIGEFPEDLLEKLFAKENLNQLSESRMKEKLFFISQSHKLLCSPQRPYLDQMYLDSLPRHLYGSWEIEKRKRPYFSIVMQRLLECVPNRYYVKSAFILKHFKSPDIIIHLNTNQQPQIIPNETKKSLQSFDKNEDNGSMYALEVLCEEELCANDPLRPLGLFYAKARQLQKLNYIPVIIYPSDSLHQVKTKEEIFKWIVKRAQATELLLNEN
ncbi:unnamed protein product [Adineta steineri]|uniref:RAP domain-containing protein n=1 Tax=Adineta steineri TaxID=433720 RepID=A0A815YMK3_9BILA|nr:unnamed protein product [Adineta steineri]CAF1571597.1 unnamed protein product [Adineta steineri]